MRSELTKRYHYSRKSEHGRETKIHWRSELGELTGMFTLKNPMTPLHYWTLRKFCNKPTAFYWARSAQVDDRCPLLTFACIYKEWFRSHNNNPDIEVGRFFANPIQIASSGPEKIAGVLEAHKSLCDQAVSLLDTIQRGEAGETPLGSWPDPQDFRLLPLYRAIVVILDELFTSTVTEPHVPIKLDDEVQRQTVLMVLTGDDNGLSAPINFDAIRSQSLPLGKTDVADDVDVIRISLRTAVWFIADLQRKEEEAFPDLGRSATNQSIGSKAHEWVEKIMHEAEEKGANNVPKAKLVAWKIEAEQQGDSLLEQPEFDAFSPIWE